MKKITNFAFDLDVETLKQFEYCYNQDFVLKASLMPDAHLGYVAPIGSVFLTEKFIVPSWVGYDIGCGVIAVKISDDRENIKELKKNIDKIFDEVYDKIPMGKGETHKSKKENKDLEILLENLKAKTSHKKLFNYVKQNSYFHIGTLGGGNHFVEVLSCENDMEIWIVVHSGSRGVGRKIATYFMQLASNSKENIEGIFKMEANSREGLEYLNFVDFCLEFAILNRLEMAKEVYKVFEKYLKNINFEVWTNKNHNHIEKVEEFYIHRKGATPANKDEKGIIPANMRDGCYLVCGLGDKKFLNSSSHGAGRVMSRKEAKQKIKINDFQNEMKDIKANISQKTIDESPFVYKNIDEVMEKQKESVKVLKKLKPIINFKGV